MRNARSRARSSAESRAESRGTRGALSAAGIALAAGLAAVAAPASAASGHGPGASAWGARALDRPPGRPAARLSRAPARAVFGYAPGFAYRPLAGAAYRGPRRPAYAAAYGYDSYSDAYPLRPPSNERYGFAWAPEAALAATVSYPYGPDYYGPSSGYYGY